MPKSRNNPLTKVGDVFSIDPETGEAVPMEGQGLRLLPPPKGHCQWCATKHDPELPHNQQSLYYRTKFTAIKGRAPTWTDAMEHCTPKVREQWIGQLIPLLKKNGMPVPDDLKQFDVG